MRRHHHAAGLVADGTQTASLVAGMTLRFAITWSMAVIAEVYTFQALLLVAALALLWQWRRAGSFASLALATVLAG